MASAIEVFFAEISPREEGGEYVSINGRCTELERGKAYRVRLSLKQDHVGDRGDVVGTKTIYYVIEDKPMSFMADRWFFDFVAGVESAGLQKAWPSTSDSYTLKVEVYQDYGYYQRKTPKSISVASAEYVVSNRVLQPESIESTGDRIGGTWRIRESTVTGMDSDDDTLRDDLIIAVQIRNMYADPKWIEEGKSLVFQLDLWQRVAIGGGRSEERRVPIAAYDLEAMETGTKGYSDPQLCFAVFGNNLAPPVGGIPYFPNKQKKYKFYGAIQLVDDFGGVVATHRDEKTFTVPPRRLVPGQFSEPPGGLKPIE